MFEPVLFAAISSGGLFGRSTAAGALLGSEPSGLAADFTASSLLIRDNIGSTSYNGNPFTANGGKVSFTRASPATRINSLGQIEAVGNNVERIDYDPVTLAARGLLMEEQRTNLLLNSATLSTQNVTVTAIPYTLSFYGTGTITLSGASTAGPLVGTGVSNRVSLTFTPSAGTLTLTVSGSVTQAQIEAGSFATSYIPTLGFIAVREADVATVSTSAFPYSGTEGTIVLNAAAIGGFSGSNNAFVSLNNGTVFNASTIYLSGTTPNALSNTSGAAQASLSMAAVTVSASQAFKVAFAVKLDDFAATANASTVQTDTLGSVPLSVNALELGAYATNLKMNGWIRQITYIPRRLSNAELQAMTV